MSEGVSGLRGLELPAARTWRIEFGELTGPASPARPARELVAQPEWRDLDRHAQRDHHTSDGSSCRFYAGLAKAIGDIGWVAGKALETLGVPRIACVATQWLVDWAVVVVAPQILILRWAGDALELAHCIGCDRGARCESLRALAMTGLGMAAKDSGLDAAVKDEAVRLNDDFRRWLERGL